MRSIKRRRRRIAEWERGDGVHGMQKAVQEYGQAADITVCY